MKVTLQRERPFTWPPLFTLNLLLWWARRQGRWGTFLVPGPVPTKDLFELTTEMGIGCKLQLSRGGLAGITLKDQLFGQVALERSQPPRRRAGHVLLKKALQVPF